jgi:hypothetical protein
MKVSVWKLKSGRVVLTISGPGTEDILAVAKHLGISPQDFVIETLRHQVALRQLARDRKKEMLEAGG